MNKPGYLVPMIVAGSVAGVLSNIPCISALNCIFCMWLVLGGGAASFIYLKMGGTYVPSDGEGVTLGLGTGAVAGVLSTALSFLTFFGFGRFQYQAEMTKAMNDVPPEMQELMEGLLSHPSLFLILGGLITMGLFMGFGMLGGYLGMRIFKPRMTGPPGGGYPYPPPPPGGYPPPPPGGYPPPPAGWSPPPPPSPGAG